MKTKTVVISGGNPGDMSVGIWPEEIDVTITYPAVMGDEEVFLEFMTEAVAAYLDTSEKRVTVSQYKPPQCVAMLTPD